MLKEIVNRLRGQVRLRVESPFPERVLNLCGARNLAFWDLEWESATAFTCRMSRGITVFCAKRQRSWSAR